MDFLGTWYSKGPAQITMNYHGLEIIVSPNKINSSVVYQNQLLSQLSKGTL